MNVLLFVAALLYQLHPLPDCHTSFMASRGRGSMRATAVRAWWRSLQVRSSFFSSVLNLVLHTSSMRSLQSVKRFSTTRRRSRVFLINCLLYVCDVFSWSNHLAFFEAGASSLEASSAVSAEAAATFFGAAGTCLAGWSSRVQNTHRNLTATANNYNIFAAFAAEKQQQQLV
jgi:hypothetical protein